MFDQTLRHEWIDFAQMYPLMRPSVAWKNLTVSIVVPFRQQLSSFYIKSRGFKVNTNISTCRISIALTMTMDS